MVNGLTQRQLAREGPEAYPKTLKTLGNHLRKRRLDLGLLQKEVAECLGVTTDTITNWELNRTEPGIHCYPAIIEFLGYVPFSMGETFPEKLKAYRMVNGLTQRQLARELGVDPTTVMKWEAGTSRPREETRERVEKGIDRAYRATV